MKQQAKPTARQRWRRLAPWLLLLALLAGLAAVHGLAANYDIGYEITNGDYQNYNPVRRLLAGQAPYRDFAVYLGAGELYSVSAVLLLIGNSFGHSVFASNFCTWFFFELLVLAGCTVVLGRARSARALTLALSGWFFLAVHGTAVPLAGGVNRLLGYAAQNGTSARMIRAAALPLAVLLLAAGLAAWQRRTAVGAETPPRNQKKLLPLAPPVLVPLVAGALVPWSNDMGAALYLAISLGYGLFLLRLYRADVKKILIETLRYILVSVCALGGAVLLASGGHPLAWLRQTRGASAYQAWYYGTSPQGKLYFFSDLRFDWTFWLCLALAVAFAVGVLRCKTHRSAALAAGGFALSFGMALWNLLYCVLSAAEEGPAGGAQALVAVLLPALAVRGIQLALARAPGQGWRRALKIWLPRTAALLAAGVLGFGLYGQVRTRRGGHEGLSYLPGLGGWIGDQADKLATEQNLLAGRRVFSTYASALEVLTGQFQPTGTDYIIHVLGDSQRLAYLQTFQAGDFDLVETPSPKVAPTERWSRNANWWFYRELYRYWSPVNTTFACGGMHLFWQRTGADGNLGVPAAAALTQEGVGSVTVTITTEDPDFCGVADVALRYGVAGRGDTGSFLHATAVTENELCAAAGRDTNCGDWFLPTDRTVYQIPVTIKNGTGVVRLTAWPAGALLTVDAAEVEATYTDWEYFFE